METSIKSNSPYTLARIHSKQLQEKYPEFFSTHLNLHILKNLLKELKISYVELAIKEITGRLEKHIDSDKIIVNSNLPLNQKIQAINHEIGHWFLDRYYPEINENQSINWKENYARSFANELSIPIYIREWLSEKFYAASSVKEILRHVSQFGLAPSFIFMTMYYDHCPNLESDSCFDNIWLICKWKPNKYTNTDSKLRIISGYFDPNKYFVAYNQGVERVIENISQLENLIPGVELHFKSKVVINCCKDNESKQFRKKSIQADCSVVRLLENSFDNSVTIILLLRLNTVD